MRELIRHVAIDDYALRLFDLNQTDRLGKHRIGYQLYKRDNPTDIVFDGEDIHVPPYFHAVDSDATIRTVLGFLTLKPGDTDAEYFKDYTPRQLAFCATDAERLSIYSIEDDESEFLPFEELDDDDADALASIFPDCARCGAETFTLNHCAKCGS